MIRSIVCCCVLAVAGLLCAGPGRAADGKETLDLPLVAQIESRSPEERDAQLQERLRPAGFNRQSDGGEKVCEVRPLDDPANPYRGQYSDFDRWALQNYDPPRVPPHYSNDAQIFIPPSEAPTTPILWRFSARVSEDGWLIPYAQLCEIRATRTSLSLEQSLLRRYVDFTARPQSYEMPVAGMLPPELWPEIMHAKMKPRAAAYPAIPQWLAEHPPIRTYFLPRGCFLCLGEMGARVIDDRQTMENQWFAALQLDDSEMWYFYDKAGQLLRSGGGLMQDYTSLRDFVSGQHYTPCIANSKDYRGLPAGQYRTQGMWWQAIVTGVDEQRLHSGEYNSVVSAEDVFGDSIDIKQPSLLSEFESTLGLNANELGTLFNEQLAQGLTSDANCSPYAGQSNGPQIAESFEPRMRHRLASSSGQLNVVNDHARRIVKALDTAGNPYRAQYSALDRFVWDGFAVSNPAQYVGFRSLTGTVKSDPSGVPWTELTNFVDTDGYMLPLTESLRLEQMLWQPRSEAEGLAARAQTAGYLRLSGGGYLTEEQRLQLCREGWAAVRDFYPRIPAWLAQRPVGRAEVLPNGQVLTYGYLGSWEPYVEHDELYILPPGLQQGTYSRSLDQQEAEARICLYSAEGELLAEMPIRADDPWQVTQSLFSPQMLQRVEEARQLNWQWESKWGYLSFIDPSTNETIASYDYDGTPVEPALREARPTVRWLSNDEIWTVYLMQLQETQSE